ncbi:WD40 repeat-containing protein, partial [Reticulomyxa filosa]
NNNNNNNNNNNSNKDASSTPANSDKQKEKSKEEEEDLVEEVDELDDTPIQQYDIVSGMYLGMEFVSEKTSTYVLQSTQEKSLIVAEVDDSWAVFALNSEFDAKDRCGHWYEGKVVDVKPAGEPITKDKRINPAQVDMEKLQKLVSVFMRYKGWEDKWNDWIYVNDDSICHCTKQCTVSAHRFAPLQTQSQWKNNKSNQGAGGGYVPTRDYYFFFF